MSLINDALKRAQQSQPGPARPAVIPPMRAVDQQPLPEERSLLSLPFLITVLVILGGFLVFSFSIETPLQVRARSHRPAPPQPTEPSPVATTPTIPTNGVVADTNGAAIATPVAIEPPKPAYKLQGIVFNPRRPSATINNEAVFIGERVGDARVTAITKETVTIVTLEGEKKTLDLFH